MHVTKRTKDEALCMLYDFATTAYNVGNFDSCHEVLTILQKAAPDGWKYMMSCIWGKMACEILMGRSETALEQFNFLKEKIEQNASLSHAEALVQRIWLLHWSLFVLFDQGRASCEGVIDLFLHHQYFNTISISCVWLLRYLAIAIIINKRRRSHIKDFVNIIQNENIITEDPFVLLIKDLCIDYDFDAARAHFSICKELIYIDFFTQRFAEEFIESARILISETYFRAHHRIYIPDLCDKLDMSHDEGEVWIADIINNTHYDADIDAITNTAVLNIQRRNVYQQVLEVTKGLVIRISSLASTLDKREQDLVEKYKTMYTGDYRSASLSK